MKPYIAMGVNLWGLEPGIVHRIFSVWLFLAALIMLGVLLIKLRKVDMSIVKKQIFITITGFAVTFIIITVTALIPMVLENKDSYPLTTLGFSIFGLFVMYTIAKYRMFLVAPTTEVTEEEEELPDEGVYPMSRERAYVKFSKFARSGYSAMGFVAMPVDEFKRKYKLVNTPLFEITKTPGKNNLNPETQKHKEMISFVIMSMLEQVYKPVILIDLTPEWISQKTKEDIVESVRKISKDVGGVFIVTGINSE